jgi:hypothetical protein
MSPRWWLAIAIVSLVWAALSYVGARRRGQVRRAQSARDEADPLRRFGIAVSRLVSGEVDYGRIPRAEARRLLAKWWDVYGPESLDATLRELADDERGANAWDLVRWVVVARLGVAADMAEEAATWQRLRPIARRLQSAYTGWPALVQAYVLARRAWLDLPRDGSADDDGTRAILDHAAALRDGLWATVPWTTRLDEPADDEP